MQNIAHTYSIVSTATKGHVGGSVSKRRLPFRLTSQLAAICMSDVSK